MVNLDDIPDFPGLPGQRPVVGAPPTVSPVHVVLVSCPLDRDYTNVAVNTAAVDAYISTEIAGGRAYETTVERWSPWGDLTMQLGLAAASRYNYARMQADGRFWYGFLDAEYLNLTTTTYRVTPDVWTTYNPRLGYSTVTRGHVAVAASAAGDISYCLEPEPFSVGSLIGYASHTPDPLGTPRVLVISTTDLTADPFVRVDEDVADTTANIVTQTFAVGTIEGHQPIGAPIGFPYAVGNDGYTDLFYYPYGDAAAQPSDAYFWPFPPNTWNVNNGAPKDEFRTPERPTHTGKDMGYGVANITGTPIKSIGPGTVLAAGWTASWGWRVLVQHPTGHWSGYAHMHEAPVVTAGQNVVAGTVLGGIGSTGDSTGNHLHFAIWSYDADDYINPNTFMAEYNPDDLVVGDDPGPASSPMYRPRAVGATPSLVDGVPAEGGAFVYPSIGAAAAHLSKLAHAPWMVDGIQRVLLIPGGSAGSFEPVDLSPRDSIPGFEGVPTYLASVSTAISVDATVAANWTAGLPAEYASWTKLRTGPYSGVQLADRLGGVSDFEPQEIVGLNALRVHFEGVYHPDADVVAWIVGSGGTTSSARPITIPVGVSLPRYTVGRDSVLAAQAAGISAERSQSAVDMILAMQRAGLDNSMNQASTFTATQFAIAEAI